MRRGDEWEIGDREEGRRGLVCVGVPKQRNTIRLNVFMSTREGNSPKAPVLGRRAMRRGSLGGGAATRH